MIILKVGDLVLWKSKFTDESTLGMVINAPIPNKNDLMHYTDRMVIVEWYDDSGTNSQFYRDVIQFRKNFLDLKPDHQVE